MSPYLSHKVRLGTTTSVEPPLNRVSEKGDRGCFSGYMDLGDVFLVSSARPILALLPPSIKHYVLLCLVLPA